MEQADDFLIKRLECGEFGVKAFNRAALVLGSFRLFELLLEPLHQRAAPFRAATLSGQHLSGNPECPISLLDQVGVQMRMST